MTTTVYVWRTFASSSRKFGGFGHVALKVGADYLSFWPPEDEEERQSYSFAFQEDLERCGRKPDREIPIKGLDEPAILGKWEELSSRAFDDFDFNCCSMAAELLKFGFNESMDAAPMGKFFKRLGRISLQPVNSLARVLSHELRTELFVHSPGEVENLAAWLADIAGP